MPYDLASQTRQRGLKYVECLFEKDFTGRRRPAALDISGHTKH